MRHLRSSAAAILAVASVASAQVRVVTWNVTNYGGAGSRDTAFKTAIYGVVPGGAALAGESMNPDVFVGQEFLSQAGVDAFLQVLNTAPGSPGDWAAAPFLDGADTESAFFWRTSRIEYIGTTTIAIGSSSTANQPRDTRRYDFRPLGYSAPSATLAVYSVHLKAQGGTNSSGRRLIEAQRIRDNAEGIDTNGPGTALPAGYQSIVAGDLNAQSSSESFYVEFVGSQPNDAGRFFDPISTPGSWNNSSTYRFIHTQDPAVQMDDRHDQILVGGGLVDGAGFEYIGAFGTPWNLSTFADPNHSYRCWGNDGTSFDAVLRTIGNTMVGQPIAQALVDSAAGLGHLPILLDLRVPAEIDATTLVDFGDVPLNSAQQRDFAVGNAGNTALFGSGIETLSYSMSASSGFSVPPGTFTDPSGGTVNLHSVSLDTSSPGIVTGMITIASNSPDEPLRIVSLAGRVVPPPACPGDLNNDSQRNTADLALFLAVFGQSVPPGTGADLNNDGSVNTADLALFLAVFGSAC